VSDVIFTSSVLCSRDVCVCVCVCVCMCACYVACVQYRTWSHVSCEIISLEVEPTQSSANWRITIKYRPIYLVNDIFSHLWFRTNLRVINVLIIYKAECRPTIRHGYKLKIIGMYFIRHLQTKYIRLSCCRGCYFKWWHFQSTLFPYIYAHVSMFINVRRVIIQR